MEISVKAFKHNTPVVSEKQYNEHLKLYKGYVDKTNEITKTLTGGPAGRAGANATYSEYRGLKKGETYALDGVILHEGYFQNLGKGTTPVGKGMERVFEKSFDGYRNWREDFAACAKAARGWCVMVYEQRTETFRNILFDLHDYGPVCMAFPIIILDMYEHAYFLDYGTDKNAYIDKFIDNICWNTVEKRIERVL